MMRICWYAFEQITFNSILPIKYIEITITIISIFDCFLDKDSNRCLLWMVRKPHHEGEAYSNLERISDLNIFVRMSAGRPEFFTVRRANKVWSHSFSVSFTWKSKFNFFSTWTCLRFLEHPVAEYLHSEGALRNFL